MKIVIRIAAAFAACVLLTPVMPSAQRPLSDPMNALAERYVKLVLALGVHDAAYVDSYYGPPEWQAEATAAKAPLAEIAAQAERLSALVTASPPADRADELVVL